MVTYTLKIVSIRQETSDTITICFKQPALRKIKYEAGQYLTLIFRINGRRYIRPYSFSSAPFVDDLLEVTVKRVPNGIVSNHIHDTVRTGDVIEVMQPLGDFTFSDREDLETIFLWGAGSGITPLISIIKFVLTSYSRIKVVLIYGNRNEETMIFADTISDLLNKYAERFRVWHFHTKLSLRKSNLSVIEGRISSSDVCRILTGYNLSNTMHYICGPVGLKESVKVTLEKLQLSSDDIFSEDFELIRDPGDFNDIRTQTIDLKFKNEVFSLEVVKGKSILESALDAGLELSYSCQTGSCSTCIAVCKGGNLRMIGLRKQRGDLKEDEYLLCCSHPLSNDVYVEV